MVILGLRPDQSRALGSALKICELALVAVSAAIGTAGNFDPQKAQKDFPTALAMLVVTLRGTPWWGVPALGLVLAIVIWARKTIGPPSAWNLIQYTLEGLREAIFVQQIQDPEHYHRVTLFRYQRWCWTRPWRWGRTGWLFAVARSPGEVTRGRIPVWRANTDDPDGAEGVAGQAFVRNRTVAVSNLADITGDDVADAELTRYSLETYEPLVSLKLRQTRFRLIRQNVVLRFLFGWRLRRRRASARYLLGYPVVVSGSRWGVMVLDSRHERPELEAVLRSPEVACRLAYLSKLLEEV